MYVRVYACRKGQHSEELLWLLAEIGQNDHHPDVVMYYDTIITCGEGQQLAEMLWLLSMGVNMGL